jgi:hypothetical protein
MFNANFIKRVALGTLIFFVCFILSENLAFPQSEDVLSTIKRHVEQGNYDEAEKLLKDFIRQKQGVSGQEHRLAEAHYLLAKVYFIVGEAAPKAEEKIEQHLNEAFKLYPDSGQNEEDRSFKERVEKSRKEFLAEKVYNEIEKIEEPVKKDEESLKAKVTKEETETVSNIIKKEQPPKKKKKKFPTLLVVGGAIVVTALVILLSKKKSKKYTLTVALDGGVAGNPAAGTYTYKKGESVNYNFSRKSGYRDLVVILDGSPAPSSGNIIMDRDHSLTASTTKIGRINSISVKFTVRFAATNLKVRHRVWIDQNLKIDEILNFRVHSSDKWEDAVKIYRTFTVNCGSNLIRIQQEAGPYYTNSYSRDDYYWIWGTYYELEIIDYTYIDGVDPGWPTLSEGWFYLNVAPWRDDPTEEWYRIKVKEITINPPSVTSKKQSKEMANQKLKGESNQ